MSGKRSKQLRAEYRKAIRLDGGVIDGRVNDSFRAFRKSGMTLAMRKRARAAFLQLRENHAEEKEANAAKISANSTKLIRGYSQLKSVTRGNSR